MTESVGRNKYRGLLERRNVMTGALSDAIINQDEEFLTWLLQQVPKGATISEALVAIAVDVKSEEQDG